MSTSSVRRKNSDDLSLGSLTPSSSTENLPLLSNIDRRIHLPRLPVAASGTSNDFPQQLALRPTPPTLETSTGSKASLRQRIHLKGVRLENAPPSNPEVSLRLTFERHLEESLRKTGTLPKTIEIRGISYKVISGLSPGLPEAPYIAPLALNGSVLGTSYHAYAQVGSPINPEHFNLSFLNIADHVKKVRSPFFNTFHRSTKLLSAKLDRSVTCLYTIAHAGVRTLNTMHSHQMSLGGISEENFFYHAGEEQVMFVLTNNVRPFHLAPVTSSSPLNEEIHFDRWSLGVLLYSLCTGYAPYPDLDSSAVSERDIFLATRNQVISYPYAFPPSLRGLVNTLTAGEPLTAHEVRFLRMSNADFNMEFKVHLNAHPVHQGSHSSVSKDRELYSVADVLETIDTVHLPSEGTDYDPTTSEVAQTTFRINDDGMKFLLSHYTRVYYVCNDDDNLDPLARDEAACSLRSGRLLQMLPDHEGILKPRGITHPDPEDTARITFPFEDPDDLDDLPDTDSVDVDIPVEGVSCTVHIYDNPKKAYIPLMDLILNTPPEATCFPCFSKKRPKLSLSPTRCRTSIEYIEAIESLQLAARSLGSILTHLRGFNVALRTVSPKSFVWTYGKGLTLVHAHNAVVTSTRDGYPEWSTPKPPGNKSLKPHEYLRESLPHIDRVAPHDVYAPEAKTHPEFINVQTDIWGAGATLFSLASGSIPYTWERHRPRFQWPNYFPLDFRIFLEQLLQEDPNNRLCPSKWKDTDFLRLSAKEIAERSLR